MKKSNTFHASSSLLGAILLISLFGTLAMSSLDAFMVVFTACKNQWIQFTETFSMIQPHRTVFPN